jgi:hypothetical protein
MVVLFGAVYEVQRRVDAQFGDFRATEEILYLDNGELLRKAVLGFENLAADLYWLRTVQYYGGKRAFEPDKRFGLLAPLLDLTTSLDPHLDIVYTFGAIFLSEPFPKGAGAPLEGIALMDKGIRANPDRWRLYLNKGFIYYWFLQDYQRAAETFLEGTKVAGAPFWMTGAASVSLARGGDRATSRDLWRFIHQTAENDQIRANAVIHLQQLDALDAIDELQQVFAAFRERAGRFPATWGELVELKLLPGVPVDPSGTPYVLNPTDERAEVSRTSALAGLYNTLGR